MLKWLALIIAVTQFSCRTLRKENLRGSLEASSSGLALLSAEEAPPIKQVHGLRLDESEFRVSGVRVGEQIFLLKNTPIIQFEVPKDADYVEIMRCPSNRIISGGDDILEKVELEARSAETESKMFKRNNFWEAAAQSNGCQVLSSACSDPYYVDSAAPTGNYIYYVRACVSPSHLIGLNQFISSNCSRQVTRSVEYKHVNLRAERQRNELELANKLEEKAQTMGRILLEKNATLANSLQECQGRHNTRVVTEEQQKHLKVMATALGAGIGGAMGATLAAATAYKGAKTKKAQKAVGAGLLGGLANAGMGAGIGYLIGSALEAWNRPPAGYPKDDPSCYKSQQKNTEQILKEAQLGQQESKALCSCADGLALQEEIKTLGAELADLQKAIDALYDKADSTEQQKKENLDGKTDSTEATPTDNRVVQ